MLREEVNALSEHSFDQETCFLCGKRDPSTITKEHVVPEWLLNRLNLRDHAYTLINGTTIRFGQLVVPCCHKCNTEYLSKLENRVRAQLHNCKQPELMATLDIFLWLQKLYFGIIYKHVLISSDRSDPKAGTILTPFNAQILRTNSFFLKSLTRPTKFISPFQEFPWTLLAFRLQTPKTPQAQFDFRYDFIGNILARIADWGFLAAMDGGLEQLTVKEEYPRFHPLQLHPAQLEELAACMWYRSRISNWVPNYQIGKDEQGYTVELMSLYDRRFKPMYVNGEFKMVVPAGESMEAAPAYEKFIQKDYYIYASELTGIPIEQFLDGSMQSLCYENGQPIEISIEEFPWRDIP